VKKVEKGCVTSDKLITIDKTENKNMKQNSRRKHQQQEQRQQLQ